MATFPQKRNAWAAISFGMMLVPGYAAADPWRFFTSVDGSMPPNAIAITDLNSDGQPDIVVTTELGGEGRIAVLVWQPTVHYSGVTYFSVPGRPVAVVTGDFDGDNNQDVAVAVTLDSGTRGGVVILFGDGTGGFRETRQTVLFALHGNSRPLALVAGSLVSGSSRIDLAATITDDAHENFVAILLNRLDQPSQDFAVSYVDTITPRNSIAAFSTFAVPDLFVTSDRISRLAGNGDGTFNPPTDFWCPTATAGTAVLCTMETTLFEDPFIQIGKTFGEEQRWSPASAASFSLHLAAIPGTQRFLAVIDQVGSNFTAFHRRAAGGFDDPTTVALANPPKALAVADIGRPGEFFTADSLPDAVILDSDDSSVTAAFQMSTPPYFGPTLTLSNHFCGSVALAGASHIPPDGNPPLPFMAVTGQRCSGSDGPAGGYGDYGVGGEGGCPPFCQEP